MYASVSDLDLFLGGVIERPVGGGDVSGALVGPTFRCLISDQFKRLKFGDRFWYEQGGAPNSFSQGRQACKRDNHQ